MESTTSRMHTIEVDDETFQRILQAAQRTGRSPARVVGQIVKLSLPSVSATRKAEWRNAVAALQHESQDALRNRLQSSLTDEELRRMEALLHANHERELTVTENNELDVLQARMLEVTTERAAAAYLLRSVRALNERS